MLYVDFNVPFKSNRKLASQISNNVFFLGYLNTGWFKKMDPISYVYISWTVHGIVNDEYNILNRKS